MKVVEAKMRHATRLLTEAIADVGTLAIAGCSPRKGDLERRVRAALEKVFEAAVREAQGKAVPLRPAPHPPLRADEEEEVEEE